MKYGEFYRFFLQHKNLSDYELAKKVKIKFGSSNSNADIMDLIQVMRENLPGG